MMLGLKRFKNSKKKLAQLDKPLLVLMSDGFGLLAAVVDRPEEEVTIVASARSSLADPVAALTEVFGRLSVSFGKLPKDSILLHAHAIPSILELGIENMDSLEEEKVQELIRWEMESVFADLVPHDNLGWLMVGLGFITEQQRDVLVHKLAEENLEHNKKIRIGDLAIAEGYVNRNQVEECLKIQDQLQLQDQRIKCGWSMLVDGKQKKWLATAVSNAIHKQWVFALQSVASKGAIGKTRLQSFYPYIGAGSSQLHAIYSGDTVYILELHRPYLALNIYQRGILLDCLVLECSSDTPGLTDIETLISSADIPEGIDIYTTVTYSARVELREQLEKLSQYHFKHLEREVSMPANIAGDLSTSEAVMILGAAFNYLNNNDHLMVTVRGITPPPPLYKRPEASFAAIVAVMLVLVLLVEGYFGWKLAGMQTKLVELDKKVDRQELVRKDLQNSQQLQNQIDSVKLQREQLLGLKQLMETVLVKRQEFTRGFLDIVSRNLNDNLIINAIEETQWNRFVISGWAVDQPSIDLYSKGLSRDLEQWDMYIAENPSTLGRNAAGFGGYNFRFVLQQRITPASSKTLSLTMSRRMP